MNNTRPEGGLLAIKVTSKMLMKGRKGPKKVERLRTGIGGRRVAQRLAVHSEVADSHDKPLLLGDGGPQGGGGSRVAQVDGSAVRVQAHGVHVGDVVLLDNLLEGRNATPRAEGAVAEAEDAIDASRLEVRGRLGGRTELNGRVAQIRAREGQNISPDRARDLRTISVLVIETALVAAASGTGELRARHSAGGRGLAVVVLAAITTATARDRVDQQIRGASIDLGLKELTRSTDSKANEVSAFQRRVGSESCVKVLILKHKECRPPM